MYYVKAYTRSPGAAKKGSPRQAVDYITDGHDLRRDPGYSDAELAYVARMGEGWKTDLEGGRVPLVGCGVLAAELDQRQLAELFERSCHTTHDVRAKTGYKSFTFTVPKEVSLFAEGHREQAKEAMYAAVRQALDRTFAGKDYAGVAAIHTRNEAGEIHYHVHVLVGKFALNRETGRVVSLCSAAGGDTGRRRLTELKGAWKETLDKEFKERLGLTIEQRAPNAAPALILPDGTRLESLNRASRRLLEKDLAPWYAVPDRSGALVQRQLRLGAMDDRIFEIAAGERGASGWRVDAFTKMFPEQQRFLGRYEKRVETLKAIGYLTPDGRLTPEFRLHFSLRHGINTPELQRIRLDMIGRAAHGAGDGNQTRRSSGAPDQVRSRIERLGLTERDVARFDHQARARRPTPEVLRTIRIEAARRALSQPTLPVPRTKTIVRGFVDLQKARAKRVYLVVTGVVTGQYADNKKIADRVLKAAERDLFYAKERRLAQLATGLRPIFWAVKVAMPRDARRLEKAVERCSRLAYAQEIRRIEREEIRRAYLDWRKSFLDRPAPGARDMYERGRAALEQLGRPEAELLRKWSGREDDLVHAVYAKSRVPSPDTAQSLSAEEHQAAVRAGQIGRLLVREAATVGVKLAIGGEDAAAVERLTRRLHAFGFDSRISAERFGAIPPAELRASLASFKRAGLLDDGPAWTLKAGTARSLAQDLARRMDRALDADRLVTDALLKRRSAP
jgi:hypothetical protein